VFEKFTQGARQAVVLTQEEARALNHNYIGTEHILLGLIREEEGAAARVLESLGVTLDRVREMVVAIVGRGTDPSSGQIPFTPRAKRALEVAVHESLTLGHTEIETEHILLGLSRESESVAVRILLDCGVDAEQLREATVRRLAGPGPAPAISLVSFGAERGEEVERSWLGGLAPVLHALQREIERTLGRVPDSGDLLLTLASAPDTRAAAALRALGVDADGLARAVGEVRAHSAPSAAELVQAHDEASIARQNAAEKQDYETAAAHRDQERQLREALDAARIGPEVVEVIRARLGLTAPPPPEA
jgi:hypothetical protein